MNYLDFEEPIQKLEADLSSLKETALSTGADLNPAIAELEEQIREKTKQIFKDLSPWQRVQLSRHPDRPYTLAYIQALTQGDFQELHGDRNVKDDKAMIGGLGKIGNYNCMFIGQQKGINTKALRLMKMAEKFGLPIVCLIDTPGAFPGLEAEERGQGEAIARNLIEMFQLSVPVICIVIGEGASGGALGIGIGDRILMLENTWYSVISPESCSSILWRTWDNKEQAASALKLTAEDMLGLKLIDGIIKEPLGGAHRDHQGAFNQVKNTILELLPKLLKMNPEKRIKERIQKFETMGVFNE